MTVTHPSTNRLIVRRPGIELTSIESQVPLTKMRGQKPQILPNFASNRNILSAVTRDVEGK